MHKNAINLFLVNCIFKTYIDLSNLMLFIKLETHMKHIKKIGFLYLLYVKRSI